MFDQGLQILSRGALEVEFASLFRRWDATAQQRADFVGWALAVATAADFYAVERPDRAAVLVRHERDLAHQLIAERLHATSSIDLSLVSKRMFLDWLAAQLARERVDVAVAA